MIPPKLIKDSIWDPNTDIFEVTSLYMSVLLKPLFEQLPTDIIKKLPIENLEAPKWCYNIGEKILLKTEYSNLSKYWKLAFSTENPRAGHISGVLRLLLIKVREAQPSKEDIIVFSQRKPFTVLFFILRARWKIHKLNKFLLGLHKRILLTSLEDQIKIESDSLSVLKSRPQSREKDDQVPLSKIASFLLINWRTVKRHDNISEVFDWCREPLELNDKDAYNSDFKRFQDLCTKIGLKLTDRGAPKIRIE